MLLWTLWNRNGKTGERFILCLIGKMITRNHPLEGDDDVTVDENMIMLFQEYHHNPVVSELQILVKRLLLCNGRNQHIPLKTLFITNSTGMTRMPMKPIISELTKRRK